MEAHSTELIRFERSARNRKVRFKILRYGPIVLGSKHEFLVAVYSPSCVAMNSEYNFLDRVTDSLCASHCTEEVDNDDETCSVLLGMIRKFHDRRSSTGSQVSACSSILRDHRNSLDAGIIDEVEDAKAQDMTTFGDSEELILRFAISSDDKIRQIISRFWELCPKADISISREEAIDKPNFFTIMLAIEKAVQENFELTQSLDKIEAKWIRDASNLHLMVYDEFHDSLFAIADEWTHTIHLYNYNMFLWDLFSAITINQVTYADGSIKDVKLRHTGSCLRDIISCIPLHLTDFHYMSRVVGKDPSFQTIGQLASASDSELNYYLREFHQNGEDELLGQYLLAKTATDIIKEAEQWMNTLVENCDETNLDQYYEENPVLLKELDQIQYDDDLTKVPEGPSEEKIRQKNLSLSIPVGDQEEPIEVVDRQSKSSLRMFQSSNAKKTDPSVREYGQRRNKNKNTLSVCPLSSPSSSTSSISRLSPKAPRSPKSLSGPTSVPELPDIEEDEIVPVEEVTTAATKQSKLSLRSVPKVRSLTSKIVLCGIHGQKLAQIARQLRRNGLKNVSIILNEVDLLTKMKQDPQQYDLLIYHFDAQHELIEAKLRHFRKQIGKRVIILAESLAESSIQGKHLETQCLEAGALHFAQAPIDYAALVGKIKTIQEERLGKRGQGIVKRTSTLLRMVLGLKKS